MSDAGPTVLGVSFKFWILAWACSIFLPCALLAALYPQDGLAFPVRALRIADEVAPMAKLMFGGLLLLAFAMLHRREQSGYPFPKAAFCAAPALVPVFVVAIIPATYSRGIGVGFSGTRFAFSELACWMAGSLLGGLLYVRSRPSA